MLEELVVEGLGVIDRAEVAFGPGCSALTGETGAGKTLLVQALQLLLGRRAERSLVGEGRVEARVGGRFSAGRDHAASVRAAAGDLLDGGEGDAELVLSRTVGAGGRSSARVNGRLVPVAVLEELGAELVEIAGQHEHVRLVSQVAQRGLLDAFAGPECLTLAAEVARTVAAASIAGRAEHELVAHERSRRAELEGLAQEIAEIEAAGIQPGEGARLRLEAARLESAAEIASGLAGAAERLRAEDGAEDSLTHCARLLEGLVVRDPALAELAERAAAAAYEVADLAQELHARVATPDEISLEDVRERLGQLARLRRRYGGEEAEILEHLDRGRARVAELQGGERDLEHARTTRAALVESSETTARLLSRLRLEAAPRLADRVTDLLVDLALPGARFEARIEPRALFEGGAEDVRFVLSANPGEAPRALAKVASGGELSRIALALRLVTASDGTGTMVFDEVDAGVGGRSAQAVGRRLAQLARSSGAQVLVVTHLPQVAAFADAHYVVEKRTEGHRAAATVRRVEGDERVAELSRMLAGLPRSERARGHARELLDLASSVTATGS